MLKNFVIQLSILLDFLTYNFINKLLIKKVIE